jgi:hypothetical protein
LTEPKIILEPEPSGGFRFTFETDDGQITGRVSIDSEGNNERTPEEKERAAKIKITQLCEGIAQASEEDRYAPRA